MQGERTFRSPLSFCFFLLRSGRWRESGLLVLSGFQVVTAWHPYSVSYPSTCCTPTTARACFSKKSACLPQCSVICRGNVGRADLKSVCSKLSVYSILIVNPPTPASSRAASKSIEPSKDGPKEPEL